MSTVNRINRSVDSYHEAIQGHSGDFNQFMLDYEAIALPIRQELVKQGNTLSGAQELIKLTGEYNLIDAIARLTKRRTLDAMRQAGILAPLPEPTYTVWCTLQCGYVESGSAQPADVVYTQNYSKAAALSLSDAIDVAISVASGSNRRYHDHVYVLNTDENVMFATWLPAPNSQGRKNIEYFEG